MLIWWLAFLAIAGFGAFAIGYLPSRRPRRAAVTLWSIAPVIAYAVEFSESDVASIIFSILFSLFYAVPWAVASVIGYSWKRELVQRQSEV